LPLFSSTLHLSILSSPPDDRLALTLAAPFDGQFAFPDARFDKKDYAGTYREEGAGNKDS